MLWTLVFILNVLFFGGTIFSIFKYRLVYGWIADVLRVLYCLCIPDKNTQFLREAEERILAEMQYNITVSEELIEQGTKQARFAPDMLMGGS